MQTMPQNRLIIFAGLLACSIFVSGCNPPRKEIIASIVQAEKKAAESYYGRDLQAAENDLLSYKKTLLNRRKEMEDAYRYDYALGLVSARLSLIYERTGRTNQAVEKMTASMEYFSRDSVALDVKEPGINEQAIREFVVRLDSKRKPEWQTDDMH